MRLALTLCVSGLPLGENSRLAAQAERAGFTTLCVGENGYDSLVGAGMIASATATARVMTAVTTWVRPPVTTALAAATIDELARGRFVLGLGTMPERWNRDYFGIEPAQPLARMREYVECVRGALRSGPGDPFHFAGRFFQVAGYERPVRTARQDVAVHLAATRPGMMRLAGEVADGVLVNVIHTMGWLGDVLLPALTAGEARSGGRRAERGVMVRCVPHGNRPEDRRRGWDIARASLAPYLAVPYLADVLAHEGWSTAEVTDPMVAQLCVVGTVAEVCASLARYDRLVDWILLAPPRDLEPVDMRRTYDCLLEVAHLTMGS